MMREDRKDEGVRDVEQRLAALRRDLRILKWQTAALLVLTYVLVFLTFCRDS